MIHAHPTAGDPIPTNCQLIEVHVGELRQLFNAMDASPFRDRDLDPEAEAFIVGWGREVPRDAPLALLVHLDRAAGMADESEALRTSVHEFFRHRSQVTMRRLRQLLQRGRTSLLIGLVALAVSVVLGDLVSKAMGQRRLGELLRESLLIGGWVAMWKPLEVFLYDWWPIRAETRLYDRLSVMPVRIEYAENAELDAGRLAWAAVPESERTSPTQNVPSRPVEAT
jgi:hypothetical protein